MLLAAFKQGIIFSWFFFSSYSRSATIPPRFLIYTRCETTSTLSVLASQRRRRLTHWFPHNNVRTSVWCDANGHRPCSRHRRRHHLFAWLHRVRCKVVRSEQIECQQREKHAALDLTMNSWFSGVNIDRGARVHVDSVAMVRCCCLNTMSCWSILEARFPTDHSPEHNTLKNDTRVPPYTN